MDKHECKELREAGEALADLGGFLAKRASDGIDLGDGLALAKKLFFEDEFQAKLVKAVTGIQKIPQEVKDELSQDGIDGAIAEAFQLGSQIVKVFMESYRKQ